MTNRAVRLLLAAGLIVGLTAGTISVGSAGPPEGPTELYLPWVPWGITIEGQPGFPDSGPYYGAITVQNLENEAIDLLYEPSTVHSAAGPFHTLSSLLVPNGSHTVSAAQIVSLGDGDVWGGGIKVIATKQSDDSPARISASMRQTSPVPPTFFGGTTSDHVTVSGYTALTAYGVSHHVYLPIVQTNNNWNTVIRATNFDQNDPTIINVELHEAGGGGTIGLPFIITDPGMTATFDLRELGVPDGWVGTAEITGLVSVGAVAERIKPETNMLMMNPARSVDQSEFTTYATLVFQDWNHWNTGISIANVLNIDNDVTIQFFDVDGNPVHNDAMTVPANGMDFFYLPAGDGTPFVGSAVIQGTSLFHGAVDEVKYDGDQPDTGHAMSYTIDYRATSQGSALAVPDIWKGDPADGGGDTSGIQIFNALDDPAEVEVMFYHFWGDPALSEPIKVTLGARQSYTAYTMFYDELQAGFRGSAVVTNTVPGGPGDPGIVVVSNMVNYDVQYDGSTSYNAIQFEP